MTHPEFLALVAGCALHLPPGVTPELLSAYAEVESGRRDVVGTPNRNGTRDHGLMQINQVHFRRLGVDGRTVREPCTNIGIAARIIRENLTAACLYNTGRPACANGYDAKVVRAHARLLAAARAPGQAGGAPAPPACGPVPPVWDGLGSARHRACLNRGTRP